MEMKYYLVHLCFLGFCLNLFGVKGSNNTLIPIPHQALIECEQRMDLVFLIDSSNSVGIDNFKVALQFVHSMLRDSNIDGGKVQVGVVTYSTDPYIHFHLHEHATKASVQEAIISIPFLNGSTNTADGLRTVREEMFNPANGDRFNVPNIAVIITDGDSNQNKERTIQEAILTHAAGVRIITIGVGDVRDSLELYAMATPPAELNRFLVKSFQDLLQMNWEIFSQLCQMIVTKGSEQFSQQLVSIPIDSDCNVAVDLVFMVDSSTSVGEANFNKVLRFVTNLISKMHINLGYVRVGVMTFSQHPLIHIHLKSFSHLKPLIEKISNIPFSYGSTNLATALNTMRTEMFVSSQGDREEIKNVAIFITEGALVQNLQQTQKEATLARENGIELFVVGARVTEKHLMKGLVSEPTSKHSYFVDFSNIQSVKRKLQKQICKEQQKEDEVEIPMETIEDSAKSIECLGAADIVFVIDTSGSVGYRNFYTILQFIFNVTSRIDIDSGRYRIGLLTFSDRSRIEIYLGNFTTQESVLEHIVQSSYHYGTTNYADALKTVREELFNVENGDRPDVKNVCILMTDGLSNVKKSQTTSEAKLVHSKAIAVVGIGIGLKEDSYAEIQTIASSPQEQFIHLVDSFGSLKELVPTLVNQICASEGQCLDNPCKHGGTCIDLLNKFVCKCSMGHTGMLCQRSCKEPADLIFLLDSSGSIGEINFNRFKHFIIDMINEISVTACNYRIGLMKFGSNAHIQFHLDQHDNNADIEGAVENVQYSFGYTDTANAVKMVREEMFVKEHGDRENASNILIIMTDGLSNINMRETLGEINLAKEAGILIVPLGVAVAEEEEIRQMATDQRKGVFFARSFSRMKQVVNNITGYLTEDTNQCRPNPCWNGGTCEDRVSGYVCLCKAGYASKNCDRRCTVEADVAFLVDSSSYIGKDNFNYVQNLMSLIVERLRLYDGNSQIAIITFSGGTKIERFLKPGTRKDLYLAINALYYDGDFPFIADAFQVMQENVFKVENGDRPKVPNFAILFTGGMLFSRFSLPLMYDVHANDVEIFGIGVGPLKHEKSENEIIQDISAKYEKKFEEMVDTIVLELCDDINQCESNPCDNGGSCVDGANTYVCQCRDGFSGRNCERGCNTNVDLIFMLDSSGSVGRGNFAKLLYFVNSIVDELYISPNESQVGLGGFSTGTWVHVYLNTFSNSIELKDHVIRMTYKHGGTNSADALQLACKEMFTVEHGDRPDVPNILIFITDGISNIRTWQTVPLAYECRDEGVHIFTIGIGLLDTEEVFGITSEPVSKNAFLIDTFDDLPALMPQMVSAVCENANLCGDNPCKHDGKCVDKGTSYGCACADGFSGLHCEINCDVSMDVTFIADMSGNKENFDFIKAFLKTIVKGLEFASGKSRVSIISFSDKADILFFLDEYSMKDDILLAIDAMNYTSGETFTAEALRIMREEVFDISRGDRPEVANKVVLITDGVSNILPQRTVPEANKSKRSGIQVYAVSVGNAALSEVRKIATQPEHVLSVGSYAELGNGTEPLLQMLCHPLSNLQSMFQSTASMKTTYSSCSHESDIVFMVDSSGSVTQAHFQRVLVFVDNLVRLFGLHNTRIGLLTFSTEAHLAFHLKEHTSTHQITAAIMAVPYQPGKSNMAAGLEVMRRQMFQQSNGDRPGIANIGVLITDGYSTVYQEETVLEAKWAKERGVQLFAVGINIHDTDELLLLTGNKSKVYNAESFAKLVDISGDLKAAICKGIKEAPFDSINQCLSNPCQNDGLCIDGDYKYTCQCLPGFRGYNCEMKPGDSGLISVKCDKKADIIFIVDISSKVSEENFRTVLNFISLLLTDLHLDTDDHRVGAALSIRVEENMLHLNEYIGDKISLVNAITTLERVYGTKNTAHAIKAVVEKMFQVDLGDRGTVKNYIVLITDNISPIDRTQIEINAAAKENVKIYAIGVGSETQKLAKQVRMPQGSIFTAVDFLNLLEMVSEVLKAVCSDIQLQSGG